MTSGYSPTVVRMVDEMDDYDLYDVLAELGWGMDPRTRARPRRPSPTNSRLVGGLPARPPPRSAPSPPVRARRHRGPGEPPDLPDARGHCRRRAGCAQMAGNPADLLRETKQGCSPHERYEQVISSVAVQQVPRTWRWPKVGDICDRVDHGFTALQILGRASRPIPADYRHSQTASLIGTNSLDAALPPSEAADNRLADGTHRASARTRSDDRELVF